LETWKRNRMLILTRRAGEAILIDGGVRIVVLGTEGGGVRLGIEAPPFVGIIREEVVTRGEEGKAGDQPPRPAKARKEVSSGLDSASREDERGCQRDEAGARGDERSIRREKSGVRRNGKSARGDEAGPRSNEMGPRAIESDPLRE